MSGKDFKIETKTLRENVSLLDYLYESKRITLAECMQIQMQLKILASLESIEEILKAKKDG